MSGIVHCARESDSLHRRVRRPVILGRTGRLTDPRTS